METTNQGTQAQAGQGAAETQTTQQGTEQAQQQAAVTQQQQAATTATTATTAAAQSPTPEQIAQWQADAQRASQLEQSYKALQAEFTRTRQAMATLTGNANGQPPQQDPLEPYVKNLVSQGYDEKDARAIAGTQYSMVQPLIQQNQQMQAAIHGNAIVGDVLREGYAKNPQLFGDPSIYQSVEQVLRAEAMRGNQITAEYALDLAFVAEGRKRMQGAQTQQQATTQTPQINGQFGWASGFAGVVPPMQQQKQAITPELQAADAAVKARYGIKKQS
jgi:hypothetical protein